MSEEFGKACRHWLGTLARLGHDMIREEYGKNDDGKEYAHFRCLNCDQVIGLRATDEGFERSCLEGMLQHCRKGEA